MAWLIIRTMLALAIVLLLAWTVLRALRRRMRSHSARDLEVIGRLMLTPKRQIDLVRIGRTIWALGYHENGMTVIGTVPPEELSPAVESPENSPGFREFMADVQSAWQARRQGSRHDD